VLFVVARYQNSIHCWLYVSHVVCAVYSKEALTKQSSPPNQDTNNVTASQDGQPTDGTAGGQDKE